MTDTPVEIVREAPSVNGHAPRPREVTHLSAVTLALNAAMRALGERAMRWATLLLLFALCVFVSWQPNVYTLAAVGIFAFIIAPIWLRKDGV